jgi:Tctex-1 family.
MTTTPVIDIVLPTYILKPDKDEKFYSSRVKTIIEEVISDELSCAEINSKWLEDWYDFDDEFEGLSKEIADKIRAKCISVLNLPRYKLIVQVTIGGRKNHGVRITSRCLWDTSTDQYASYTYQNEHLWVSAMVFGLYTD